MNLFFAPSCSRPNTLARNWLFIYLNKWLSLSQLSANELFTHFLYAESHSKRATKHIPKQKAYHQLVFIWWWRMKQQQIWFLVCVCVCVFSAGNFVYNWNNNNKSKRMKTKWLKKHHKVSACFNFISNFGVGFCKCFVQI